MKENEEMLGKSQKYNCKLNAQSYSSKFHHMNRWLLREIRVGERGTGRERRGSNEAGMGIYI